MAPTARALLPTSARRRLRRLAKAWPEPAPKAPRKAAKPKPKPKPKSGRRDPDQRMPRDYDPETREIVRLVRPYTMTSHDKIQALVAAVRYVERAKVPGAIVECGVWRGGSMHAVARVLDGLGDHDRELYLFDTFEGMTEPTERDIRVKVDKPAAELMATSPRTSRLWAVASIEDVREGLATLPYPQDRFHLVKGPVEETIPDAAPEQIALLRLDTDWYESTRHELEHLYERLQPGGVLIIDDYGTWQGSKEATDEFVAGLDHALLLHRAGRARVAVKPG
jgi:hypothetical protein